MATKAMEIARATAAHDEELRRWGATQVGQYYVVNTTTGRVQRSVGTLREARALADDYAEAWPTVTWEVVAQHGDDGGPQCVYTA